MGAKGDYPIINFHFQVEWGENFRMGFSEVSGLSMETNVIEYREGNSKTYNVIKQPGRTVFGNIILKRGVFEGDFDFYKEWRKTYLFQEGNKTGSLFRRTVIIKVLNEEHAPIITWKLINAWPCKIQWSDLNAKNNEVFIETMELVNEGIELVEVD
jgi:phage tail-like protein